MTDLHKALDEYIEKQAAKEKIYEPKWGGKDHSGYETMMKYEINYEREECFEKGANLLKPLVIELVEALEYYGAIEKYNEHGAIVEHRSLELGFKARSALNSLKEKIKG